MKDRIFKLIRHLLPFVCFFLSSHDILSQQILQQLQPLPPQILPACSHQTLSYSSSNSRQSPHNHHQHNHVENHNGSQLQQNNSPRSSHLHNSNNHNHLLQQTTNSNSPIPQTNGYTNNHSNHNGLNHRNHHDIMTRVLSTTVKSSLV